MRGNFALQLDDGEVAWDVTDRTRDLRYRKNASGGDVDLTCQALIPGDLFTDLGPGGSARLYDAATAELLFTGDLTHPGVTDGPGGQLLDLQVLGAASRMQANKTALAYVHTVTDGYGRSGTNSTKGSQTQTSERPDGTPTLEVSWDKGYGVDSGDIGEFVLRAFQQARLKVGRFRADIDAGLGSAGYKQRLMSGTDVASLSAAAGADASTTAGTLAAYIGSGISAGDDIVAVRAIRSGGDETAAKATWFRFWNLVARQLLKDKFGNDITGSGVYTGADANQVYTHQVIADMLGRGMCPGTNPVNATIATFTHPIDALTWLDGITMNDAMEALQKFERDLWWTAYGDIFTAGLWDFTSPRYIFSKDDGGITHPGEENTLCNRVEVTWTDRKGKDRTTVVTVYVEELGGDPSDPDFDGIIRDAEPVTLDAGAGSDNNALRAGQEALRVANNPPRAGSALIRRPILDLWSGELVTPAHIKPACVVIEQETGDLLQLTDTDHSDVDAATTVTLNDPVRTIAQRLARKRRGQRRRH